MKNGTFVFDAHTGVWDASPENTKNRFGDAFIETFYAFHKGLNPPDLRWTMDYETQFRKVDPDWDLEEVERQIKDCGVRGFKWYTAEWRGPSRGWSANDPMVFPLYEKCLALGVK